MVARLVHFLFIANASRPRANESTHKYESARTITMMLVDDQVSTIRVSGWILVVPRKEEFLIHPLTGMVLT